MKIKELAAETGKSKATIYNLISASRFTIRQITDREGNITERGQKILSEILSERDQQPEEQPEQLRQQLTEAEKVQASLREEISGLRQQLTEETKKAEQLREQLTEAEERTDQLRQQLTETAERAEKWESLYIELQNTAAQERAESAQQLRAAHVLLSQQQEINNRLLMNPIKRLFAGRKKGGEQ